MAATVSFNPMQTVNAAGSFNIQSLGYVQGQTLPDPAKRFSLSGGALSSAETLPMWAGVGIYEQIPAASANINSALGNLVGRATGLTGSYALSGFSVSDQDYSSISTPQSPVGLIGSGMGVHFFRLGSGARIPLAIDPSLASLEGGLVGQQVSWDFGGQRLVPYVASYPSLAVSSGTYVSSTGVLTVNFGSAPGVVAGDDVAFTGVNYAALNQSWTVLSVSTNTITVQALTGLGSLSITGGTMLAGGGAVNVEIIEIQIGNSMTIAYDPTTGFATWNRNGSVAIALI